MIPISLTVLCQILMCFWLIQHPRGERNPSGQIVVSDEKSCYHHRSRLWVSAYVRTHACCLCIKVAACSLAPLYTMLSLALIGPNLIGLNSSSRLHIFNILFELILFEQNAKLIYCRFYCKDACISSKYE